jgi:hypothetical protein
MRQIKTPSSFGSTDRPACVTCGQAMHLVRRWHEPTVDDEHERQQFECPVGHVMERTVDVSGSPA